MSKYCPSCGEELVDNAKFCKSCGINLETMEENRYSHQENTRQFIEATEKSHTAAIVIGYILAILVPLLGLIVAVYLLTRDESKAKRHGKYILIVTVIVWILSIISIFR